jgi:mannose-6-phosphate isomerase-like protein (cupin superfamily)
MDDMIKRNSSYESQVSENMRGGTGSVKIEHLLSPDELNNKGRLFAKITLEPGASIGSHVHEGEMESYYIVSGKAEYDDDGETITLYPGDTTHTPVGGGHAIKNAGNEALEFIALILFE